MTPSKKAKEAGLSSLKELSEISGESTQTLNNWFNNKPFIFEATLALAVVKLNEGKRL